MRNFKQQFIKENKDIIIKLSILTEKDIELKINDNEKKLCYFLISRCLSKSTFMMNEIISDFKNNVRKTLKLKNLYEDFLIINVEIEISEKEFRKYVNSVFTIDSEDNIELESIIEFHQKNYSLKVKVTDFLDISLNSIASSYDLLEKKIVKIFDKNNNIRDEVFSLKEFLPSIIEILGVSENEWKINEYFL